MIKGQQHQCGTPTAFLLEKEKIKEQVWWSTSTMVREIDTLIGTSWRYFRAHGCHSGDCFHDQQLSRKSEDRGDDIDREKGIAKREQKEDKDKEEEEEEEEETEKESECCWYFSTYFCDEVSEYGAIAWLQVYVNRGELFCFILEDFAFLSVFYNDIYLVLNLALGILRYFDAYADMLEQSDDDLLQADRARLLHSTGWSRDWQFLDSEQATKQCAALLDKNSIALRKLLLLEAEQLRNCNAERKAFESIGHALLAPLCLQKNSLVSHLFVLLFVDVLPQAVLLQYNADYKRIAHRMYGAAACRQLAEKFATHRRVRSIGDARRREQLAATLREIKATTRRQLEDQRIVVSAAVRQLRASLLKFLHNFLAHSPKLLVMLYMAPKTLCLLNRFRLHLLSERCESLERLVTFSYDLMTGPKEQSSIPGSGACTSTDQRVLCAPYCFHCGAYMHDVWPIAMKHKQLPYTELAKQSDCSFVCRCETARYCSERCLHLHWPVHRLSCDAI